MSNEKRAGILARVSLDRDGESESPDQQLGDGYAVAASRGWTVTQTYVERDVSGYKQIARPQYDRLVADMRAGKLDVVVVWAIDRLTRQGVVGISKFMQVMDETGVELVSVTQPFLDTTTPLGEGVLALVASLAKQESENISTRVKRHRRYAATKGVRHTGGYRTFGYSCPGKRPDDCAVDGCPHDGVSVIPSEADLIREAVRRILGGESLWSVCRDFNERGIKTSGAGVRRKRRGALPDPITGEVETYVPSAEWQTSTLSRVLRSPVIAGIVQHDGRQHDGDWERIISQEQHAAVVQALTVRPATRRYGDRHLLTGLIRCARCGARLKYAVMKNPNGTRFPRYQCVKQPGHECCGKLAIAMSSTDEHVTAEVLDFLATARLRPLDDEVDVAELERQLQEAQAAITDLLHDRYVRRTVTAQDFDSVRAALVEQVEILERRLAGARKAQDARTASLPLGDRDALQTWWDATEPEERREALRQVVRQVTIHPAKRRGGNRYDSTRVKIDFNMTVFLRMADRAEPTPEDEAAYLTEAFEETQQALDAELSEPVSGALPPTPTVAPHA